MARNVPGSAVPIKRQSKQDAKNMICTPLGVLQGTDDRSAFEYGPTTPPTKQEEPDDPVTRGVRSTQLHTSVTNG